MIGRLMKAKAGGPALLVEQIVSDRRVACSFMDPMGQQVRATFQLSALEAYDADASVKAAEAPAPARDNTSQVLRRLARRLRRTLHLF